MIGDLLLRTLGKPTSDLNAAEKRVLRKARERRAVSIDSGEEFLTKSSFGDRLADSIARIGGSWAFIVGFLIFLFGWIAVNTLLPQGKADDPYPFIFLNLILSMIAAIQAPIIMMSQNRQSERDRFMAAKDYEVNLKAEIEVLALHNKIDSDVLLELRNLRSEIDSIRASMGSQPPSVP